MKSGLGKRLLTAKPSGATAIFELSPTAPIFGDVELHWRRWRTRCQVPRLPSSAKSSVDVPTGRANDKSKEVQTAARRTHAGE